MSIWPKSTAVVLGCIMILGMFGLSYDVLADKENNNGKAKGCEKANENSKAREKNPHCEVTPSGPTIAPESGPIGISFTITDQLGRIQAGDLAVFYVEGTNPAGGTPADGVVISPDGKTLTGNVPDLVPGLQYFVSVTPALGNPSRFNDLAFFVTL